MNNRELYQKTFSKVCSSSVILWEDMENQSRKKPGRKFLALVIASILITILSAVALAGEWFGLREMELREEILIKEQNGEEAVISSPSGVIGLKGFTIRRSCRRRCLASGYGEGIVYCDCAESCRVEPAPCWGERYQQRIISVKNPPE